MAVPLGAFAVGAVIALLVGVAGSVHDPTQDGLTSLWFDSVLGMKIALTLVVGGLALLQVVGALVLYGKLGVSAPPWLGTVHRTGGATALLLTVFVAYHCLWGLGLATYDGVPVRVVAHGVLGCVVIGALVVKVVAVRSHRAPGWFLPVAGGLLFATLIAVVWTSAILYLAEWGWPGG